MENSPLASDERASEGEASHEDSNRDSGKNTDGGLSFPSEEEVSGGKTSGKRKRIAAEQLEILEEVFRTTHHPSLILRNRIASRLDLSLRSVQIWFQNRRAKAKKNGPLDPYERETTLLNGTPHLKSSLSLTPSADKEGEHSRLIEMLMSDESPSKREKLQQELLKELEKEKQKKEVNMRKYSGTASVKAEKDANKSKQIERENERSLSALEASERMSRSAQLNLSLTSMVINYNSNGTPTATVAPVSPRQQQHQHHQQHHQSQTSHPRNDSIDFSPEEQLLRLSQLYPAPHYPPYPHQKDPFHPSEHHQFNSNGTQSSNQYQYQQQHHQHQPQTIPYPPFSQSPYPLPYTHPYPASSSVHSRPHQPHPGQQPPFTTSPHIKSEPQDIQQQQQQQQHHHYHHQQQPANDGHCYPPHYQQQLDLQQQQQYLVLVSPPPPGTNFTHSQSSAACSSPSSSANAPSLPSTSPSSVYLMVKNEPTDTASTSAPQASHSTSPSPSSPSPLPSSPSTTDSSSTTSSTLNPSAVSPNSVSSPI